MNSIDDAPAIAAPFETVGPVERALALRSLPLFQELRARQVALLASLMREYVAPRGTMLQRAGERVRTVYLLRDGRVRQTRDGQVLPTLDAPDALGLVDWLADERVSASAVAETDITALAIDAPALRDVLEDNFPLILHLRRVLGDEIAALERELGSHQMAAAMVGSAALSNPAEPLDLVGCLVRLQGATELRALGVAVLAALLRGEGTVRAAAGDQLWAAGAEATRFLVMVHGEATCTPPEPHAPFHAGAGDMLGRDAALAGLPYPYRAVADGPVVAIPIDAHAFWDVAEDHFHVAHAALAMAARRLISLKEQLATQKSEVRSQEP
jgi:CRP-like cAMP-binding protein